MLSKWLLNTSHLERMLSPLGKVRPWAEEETVRGFPGPRQSTGCREAGMGQRTQKLLGLRTLVPNRHRRMWQAEITSLSKLSCFTDARCAHLAADSTAVATAGRAQPAQPAHLRLPCFTHHTRHPPEVLSSSSLCRAGRCLVRWHAVYVSALKEPRARPSLPPLCWAQSSRTLAHTGFFALPARTANAGESKKKGAAEWPHTLQRFCGSPMSCASSARAPRNRGHQAVQQP